MQTNKTNCYFCNEEIEVGEGVELERYIDIEEEDSMETISIKDTSCEKCDRISKLVNDEEFQHLLNTILHNNLALELNAIMQEEEQDEKVVKIYTGENMCVNSSVSINVDTLYGNIKFIVYSKRTNHNLKDLINFEIDLKRILSLI